jgi:hypothetical protein
MMMPSSSKTPFKKSGNGNIFFPGQVEIIPGNFEDRPANN